MRSDRTCEKRMDEMAGRLARTGLTQYSLFLTPAEQEQAQISAKKRNCGVSLWGGFPDAERKMAAFWENDGDLEWPVCIVAFSWNERFGSIGHREMLGSLMSLGIGRERYGDILVTRGCAHAIVHRSMAEFVAAAVQSVGRIAVSGALAKEMPAHFTPDGEEIRLTVSSLRLDVLIGAAWRLPRSRAQEIVASGLARVDYCPELRPDRVMEENTLVSVRGMGRFQVVEVMGKTKRGRICVLLARY